MSTPIVSKTFDEIVQQTANSVVAPAQEEPKTDKSLGDYLDNGGFSVSPAMSKQISKNRPPQLIAGLLPSRAVVTLAGDPGIGKTFTAIDWAACISTGRDWHGIKTGEAKHVAYVVGEGWFPFGDRLTAWENVNNAVLTNNLRMVNGQEPLHTNDGQQLRLDLCNPVVISHLIQKLKVFSPALVVFDTFSVLAHVQSENDNSQVASVYANLQRIVSEVGTTVVVLHHLSKGEGRVRGAGAFVGNSDTVIAATYPKDVSGHSDESEGFFLSTYATDHGKQRDCEPMRVEGFHIRDGGIVRDTTEIDKRAAKSAAVNEAVHGMEARMLAARDEAVLNSVTSGVKVQFQAPLSTAVKKPAAAEIPETPMSAEGVEVMKNIDVLQGFFNSSD